MNRKVYIIAAILVLAAIAIISFKMAYGGVRVTDDANRSLWRVTIVMKIEGEGKPATVNMFLPIDTERQYIYNEHFDNDGTELSVRVKKNGDHLAGWHSTVLDEPKRILYTFSVQGESRRFTVPENVRLPSEPFMSYSPEFHQWLKNSKYIQSENILITNRLKKIIGNEKDVSVVVSMIYNFVKENIKYEPGKGSKDAITTLADSAADCGGKARLFVALCRASGIPSRVVGGLVLNEDIKDMTHVWAENYIDGKWIPFDASNGNYAFIPENYLELYRGDFFFFKHKNLLKFGWLFVINKAQMPPVDNIWSLYALPVYFQNTMNALLLIPLGALVIAFCRNMVGLDTFGTFSPMLLAMAFRELSLGTGLLVIGGIVSLGCLLRRLLDDLKVLFIPKLSIILSANVIFIMVMIILSFHRGAQQTYYATFLPLVIITWIIERFTISQIEDGTKVALNTALGTTLVAVSVYWVMKIHAVQIYFFAFPELILVVIAILLLVGRYSGMKVVELWRFRELIRRSAKH